MGNGEQGTGNREINVEMWKQPIPTANYQCRHSNWVLGSGIGNTSTLAHFFPGSRPQRLTQVASRHARVTLASMWLRRAMPYATIDPRVGRMELRQKRLWRSRHGRRRSHIGFDAAFASGHRPVALMGEWGTGNREQGTGRRKCGNSQYKCCQLSMSPLELGVGFWHWQHFHIGNIDFGITACLDREAA